MDTRTLTEYSGITGVLGGSFTSIASLVLWSRYTGIANSSPTLEAGVNTTQFMIQRHITLFIGVGVINFIILITVLSMGILSLRRYKELKGVNKMPSALFIIASIVFFIPFVGKLTSGILAIIGGILFFTNLKKLD
ncbi:hypothetical protein RCG39_08335 [Lactococcus petauri]|nr:MULTISPECIES: hypothetical protein [Lactococcus]MBS4460431.1 hypothetical protein [Lactococcus petauri]MDQ7119132.1 hypothetical protein [Lactococcus petauri]MDQ7126994.1 hypothetical protein [Lactococcus petauri]MDQ7128895.1 hypothetical protein [Lactococcus petauri]MDQ7138735.1 hypothetical protein [Lactococcus petauri]